MTRYSTRITDWQRRQDSMDALPPDNIRTFTAYDLDHARHMATAQAPGPSLIEQDRERIAGMRAVVLMIIGCLVGLTIVVWSIGEIVRTWG